MDTITVWIFKNKLPHAFWHPKEKGLTVLMVLAAAVVLEVIVRVAELLSAVMAVTWVVGTRCC